MRYIIVDDKKLRVFHMIQGPAHGINPRYIQLNVGESKPTHAYTLPCSWVKDINSNYAIKTSGHTFKHYKTPRT